MLEIKGQSENIISASIADSLQIINRFLSSYPPDEAKQCSWDLLMYAFGSEEANNLSHLERSNMLYFYEQINKVCEALVVINEHLLPLYVRDEE